MSLWDIATGIIDLLTLPWTSRKTEVAIGEGVSQQYHETEESRKLRELDAKTKALGTKHTQASETKNEN